MAEIARDAHDRQSCAGRHRLAVMVDVGRWPPDTFCRRRKIDSVASVDWRPSAPTTLSRMAATWNCFGIKPIGSRCVSNAIRERVTVGRRGPLPKPTAQKKFEGNPGKRKLPENEPQPRIDDDVPPSPEYLPPIAQAAWRSISRELHSIGLLTAVDYHALEQYCTAYCFWRSNLSAVQERITNGGSVVTRVNDEKGQLRYEAPMTEVSLMLKFGGELNRWSKVLGLGPAYRVALTTGHGDEPPDDPLGSNLENG